MVFGAPDAEVPSHERRSGGLTGRGGEESTEGSSRRPIGGDRPGASPESVRGGEDTSGRSKASWRSFCGRIHFFEAFAVVNAIVVLVVIRIRVGWIGWRAIGATLWMGTAYTVAMILLALVFRTVQRILVDRNVLPAFLATVRNVSPLFLLRVLIGWSAASFGYMWLKLMIPLLRNGTYDAALWRLDILLHGGAPPARPALDLLSRFGLLFPLDTFYASFLGLVTIVFSWYLLDRDAAYRIRFVNGLVLVWILGAWLYLAVPALGPCYVHPGLFRPFWSDMPLARLSQVYLQHNFRRILYSRTMGMIPAPFNPGAGIAAFPSLHVATWAYYLFATARRGRWPVVVFTIMTLTTLVGPVATGWHYAVDGYAGIVVAGLSAWLGAKIPPSILACFRSDLST